MKKSHRTKLPWLLASAILTALIVYGLIPEPTLVDVVLVKAGSLQITVDAEGETQVKERYMVTAPIAGKMVRLRLRAGDPVERGVTLLARIEAGDPALLDARYRAESKARVSAAEASRLRAQAVLESSKEASEIARHEFDRAQKLQKSNAISQADFDQAEHQHRISLHNTRSAEFALKVSEYELEMARVALTKLDPTGNGNGDNAMELTSPINGSVLRVLREDGGIVSAGSEILEIGDLTDLEMKIDVLSKDAVKIPLNAKIVIDQWGGPEKLNGIVRRVEPAARTKVSALGIEEKRVYVLADFASPFQSRASLGDGFRFEASIIVTETDPETLIVPAAALFYVNDRWLTYRIINNKAQACQVEVGLTNGTMTQVLAGLEAGDRIINHPSTDILNNSRVRSR